MEVQSSRFKVQRGKFRSIVEAPFGPFQARVARFNACPDFWTLARGPTVITALE